MHAICVSPCCGADAEGLSATTFDAQISTFIGLGYTAAGERLRHPPHHQTSSYMRSYAAAASHLGIANAMAQQSSGEFASANPTKGEEDARVQERGIRAKISLNPRSHLQHLQRPTPSDI